MLVHHCAHGYQVADIERMVRFRGVSQAQPGKVQA